MQKILKYVYLKSQTPQRHAKPEGFVYFQIIGKPINGMKKQICFCCIVCSNLGHLCVFFNFISLLSHLAKILNSSAVICMVDLLHAQNFLCFKKSSQGQEEQVHAPFYITNQIFSAPEDPSDHAVGPPKGALTLSDYCNRILKTAKVVCLAEVTLQNRLFITAYCINFCFGKSGRNHNSSSDGISNNMVSVMRNKQ